MTRQPDVAAFAAALHAAGIASSVETRGNLALIVASPADAVRLASADLRRRVLSLGREQGFTHVAVELGAAQQDDAAVLRR